MKVRLEEALTPEQKKEVDTWSAPHHSFSDHAFPSPSHDKVTIPVGHYDKGEHEDEIGEHLAKHGMQIHDYRQGLAKDKHGRLVKIGKALGKTGGEHLLEKFTGDPARVSKASGDHVITISRHPHDVAGMTSSGHSWENASCMNFESGSNRGYLPNDVEHGTHVAYYHHKDDVGLEKPLARIALKPFTSQDGKRTILSPETRSYGNAPGSFEKTVRDWADKHFGTDDTDTNIYTRHKKVYDDSGKKYIGGLGSLANAQKMHGEEGVCSIIEANEHKITSKQLDDLVPEYFEHGAIHRHPKLEQKHVDWILHNADADKHELSGYRLESIYGNILNAHKDKISKNAIDHIISLPESKVTGYTKDDFLTHPNAPDHAIQQRIIKTRFVNFHNVGPQIFAHKAAADSAVHDTIIDALKKQGPRGVQNFNKEGISNYASNNHLHPLDIDDLIDTAHERMDTHEIQHHPQSRGGTIEETTNYLISGLANNPSLSKDQAHKVLGLAEKRSGTDYSIFEHGDALRNLAKWHAEKDPVLTNRLVGHALTGLKHVNGYIREKAATTIGIMQETGILSKENQHDILTSIDKLHKAARANREYDSAARYMVSANLRPQKLTNLHPDIRKNVVEGVYGPLPLKRLAQNVPLTEEEQLKLPDTNIGENTGSIHDNPLRAQINLHPVHPKTWDKLVSHESPTMRAIAAAHPGLPDHHLATLLKDPNPSVKLTAIQNKHIEKHLDTIVEGDDKDTMQAVFRHGKDRHIHRMLDRMHEDSPIGHYITNKFAHGLGHPETFKWANLNPAQVTKVAHAMVHHHKRGLGNFTEEFIEGLRSHHGESPFYVMHNYAEELSKKEKLEGRVDNEKDIINLGLARSQHTPHDILRKLAHGPDHSLDVDVHKRLANNTRAPDDVIQHLSKHPNTMVANMATRELKRRRDPNLLVFESATSKTRVYLLG